jgi:hypothetical protein
MDAAGGSPRAARAAARAARRAPAPPALKSCVVCWDAPREVVLTACGHAVLCRACLTRLMGDEEEEDDAASAGEAHAPAQCPLCHVLVPPRAYLALHALPSLDAPQPDQPASSFQPAAVRAEDRERAAALKRRSASDRLRAIAAGDAAFVRAALEGHGPDAEALLRAVISGMTGAVHALLARGTQPDVERMPGVTALHVAALCGHARVAAMLLDAGAHVDGVAASAVPPIYYAVRGGREAVVRLLLERGARAPRFMLRVLAAQEQARTLSPDTCCRVVGRVLRGLPVHHKAILAATAATMLAAAVTAWWALHAGTRAALIAASAPPRVLRAARPHLLLCAAYFAHTARAQRVTGMRVARAALISAAWALPFPVGEAAALASVALDALTGAEQAAAAA